MQWNATTYMEFEAQRNIAIIDLIQKVKPFLQKCESILDVGCGPANSTRLLAENFPNASLLGIDNSTSMLKKAKSLETTNCIFRFCDVNNDLLKVRQKFDLIFANASLHWIHNQEKFFKEVLQLLEPSGVLAVQIPLDTTSLFHQTLQNLAKDFRLESKDIRAFYSLQRNEYYDILVQHFQEVVLWESTYIHPLENIESILRWYRGSGLRAYLEIVRDKEAFENELLKRLQQQIQPQKNGNVLLAIPRLFFIAKKATT